jgi:hypothetical protein
MMSSFPAADAVSFRLRLLPRPTLALTNVGFALISFNQRSVLMADHLMTDQLTLSIKKPTLLSGLLNITLSCSS